MVSDKIAQALRGECQLDDLSGVLRTLLAQGTSPETIARKTLGTSPEYETLKKVMASLEALTAEDQALGIILMIGLYPAASDLFAHDICDSIELWLEHEGNKEVRDFALSMQTSSPPFSAPEQLLSWIDLLDGRD